MQAVSVSCPHPALRGPGHLPTGGDLLWHRFIEVHPVPQFVPVWWRACGYTVWRAQGTLDALVLYRSWRQWLRRAFKSAWLGLKSYCTYGWCIQRICLLLPYCPAWTVVLPCIHYRKPCGSKQIRRIDDSSFSCGHVVMWSLVMGRCHL